MWRIRIIRALIFVAIVGFVALLVMQWQRPVTPHVSTTGPRKVKSAGSGLDIISYDGNEPKLSASIDTVRVETDDTTLLDGIKNFTVNRVGRPPLIVDAAEARAKGAIGARAIDFLSGVKVYDPEADLTLTLPNLAVDEAEGTATTPDSLTLEGAQPERRRYGTGLRIGRSADGAAGIESRRHLRWRSQGRVGPASRRAR